jgi:hypothetical protein
MVALQEVYRDGALLKAGCRFLATFAEARNLEALGLARRDDTPAPWRR